MASLTQTGCPDPIKQTVSSSLLDSGDSAAQGRESATNAVMAAPIPSQSAKGNSGNGQSTVPKASGTKWDAAMEAASPVRVTCTFR